jgi:hypothetical protein
VQDGVRCGGGGHGGGGGGGVGAERSGDAVACDKFDGGGGDCEAGSLFRSLGEHLVVRGVTWRAELAAVLVSCACAAARDTVLFVGCRLKHRSHKMNYF